MWTKTSLALIRLARHIDFFIFRFDFFPVVFMKSVFYVDVIPFARIPHQEDLWYSPHEH